MDVREGWFGRYLDWVMAHRRLVVAALAVVTLFWCSCLPSLRVEIDPDANLPQSHPYIQALQVLEHRFGEKNLIVVGLFPHDGTIYTPAFLGRLERVTRRINEIPGLIRSTYLSIAAPLVKSIEGVDDTLLVQPVMDQVPSTPEEVAEVRRRLLLNRLFVGNVVAADGSAAAIVANFRLSPQLPGFPAIQDRVEALVREENDGSFTAHFGGIVTLGAGMAHVTERTIMLFPLAILVVALIHYEAFRTYQGMILPLMTALLAVVWSLGLMGLLRIPLDPFNTTTPVLILAVAAGHAVQILKRYYEEYDRYHDSTQAIRRALLRVGPVMVTAGIIAALSFFSLIVFATATIRNFGLLTGFGILSALCIELTLIPALRAMLPPPRATEIEREARSGRVLERGLAHATDLIATRPRAVIAASLGVAVFSAIGASRLHVDTSLKREFSRGHPIRVSDDALNAAFAGTSTLVFLVEGPTDGSLHDPTLLRAIEHLQRFIEQDPAVGKTLSVVDFLAAMNRAMHGGDPAAATVPPSAEAVSQYLFLYPLHELNSQIDVQHRSAVVRVFLRDDSTEYGERLLARVRAHVSESFPPGVTVRYSGTIASNAALTETMVHGKILNIIQIAAIILVVAALVMRSLLAGLLIATPLAIAVLVNFGVMGLVGIPLDCMTAPIAAMAVGIGSDYAVYFLFRFREESVVSGTPTLALASTMRSSGKAIVYVSSAIAGGYLVLCVSGFVYHVELGVMVALAMVVSSLAAITLLPALLLVTNLRFLPTRALEVTPPTLLARP